MQATIPTSTFRLTRDSAEWLLSLPSWELTDYLRPLPKPKQKEILRQLATMPDPAKEDEEKEAEPLEPTPRQREFLELSKTCEEILYGGAAGGGKSEALLMWLAEGVKIPSYCGIVFRRTYAQLEKSNESLVAKSQRMYRALGGKYNAGGHFWRFPSGARIEFGHLQHAMSIYDYQGPSYHRVAYDELTQFTEEQYTYMFSRQRATVDFTLKMGTAATANPGGAGHGWVKRRFISQQALTTLRGLDYREPSKPGTIFHIGDRAFIPARLADNPFIKFDEYVKNLQKQNPVDCERLLNGDWSIAEGLIIPEDWLRYYATKGDHIVVLDVDRKPTLNVIDSRACRRFATIDTAGTSQDKADEARGKAPAYSVVAVWDHWRQRDLLCLRHVYRARVAWNELKVEAARALQTWGVKESYVENAHFGQPLSDELRALGLRCELIGPTIPNMADGYRGAKLERAVCSGLVTRCKEGKLLLPNDLADPPAWLFEYLAELTAWSGHPDEVCDQIDATSYAAYKVKQSSGGHWAPIKTQGMRRS